MEEKEGKDKHARNLKTDKSTKQKSGKAGGVLEKMQAHRKEVTQRRDYGYYEQGKRKELYMDAETAKREAKPEAAPICPYCQQKAVIQTAQEYKGRSDDYCYWVCPHCSDVCVTTIPGGYYASGDLANTELRKMRSSAHRQIAFKKQAFTDNRLALQHWIATLVEVDVDEAKIGRLSVEQLKTLQKKANEEVYETNFATIFERPSQKSSH